jgi:high-affinity nickel permease
VATSAHPAAPSRRRIRDALTAAEWRRAAALAAAVLALHAIGFGLLVWVIVPADLTLGTGAVFGVGIGMTAYTLGMRHASTRTTSPRSTTSPASSWPRASAR